MAEIIPHPSFSGKIIRNTVFNMLGRFWGFLVALILTPYMISHLGLERFGVWAIVGAVTGYFGLLDLGIGSSFVKYIAEFDSRGESENIAKLINTGFFFYLAFTVVITAIPVLCRQQIFLLLKIPAPLYPEASFILVTGVILFGFNSAIGSVSALVTGLQRMDIANKIAIIVSLPSILGTVICLEHGWGLRGLMTVSVVICVLGGIIQLAVASRLMPSLRFSWFLFDRGMLKRMFGFGIKVEVARIEDLITFQTDKLLIAHFLNFGLVSVYEIGNIIITKARTLPLLLVSAVIPAASEASAISDRDRLLNLYERGTKYLCFTGMPLLVFVAVNAPLIVFTWLGTQYPGALQVIWILAPCYVINLVTGVSSSMAIGMGKPGFQVKAGTFQLLANLVLSIVLIIKIGFVGVVVGTLVSLTLSSIWFMRMFHRDLRYPLWAFLRRICAVPLALSLAAGALNLLFMRVCAGPFFFYGRGPTALLLLVNTTVFASFYLFSIFRLGYFDEYDKGLVRKRLLFLNCLVDRLQRKLQ